MPSVADPVRRVALATAAAVALFWLAPAQAQLDAPPTTAADLRQALIWTGHLSAFADNDTAAALRSAAQSWQKSRNYPPTETLPEDQLDELVADGLKQRDAVGWAELHDKSVGFSIGVPTRLVRLVSPRPDKGALWYDFEGSIGYSIGVRYGEPNCSTMNAFLSRVVQQVRPSYRQRKDDWFAVAYEASGRFNYAKAVCRTSGVILADVSLPLEQAAAYAPVLAAMADSLRVRRSFNATATPRPKLEEPPPVAADFVAERASRPRATPKVPATADGAGTTAALARESRSGDDLRTEEVFEKVSGAVYKVKADKRLGSAVAISGSELLTNCHVIGEARHVTLVRAGAEIRADVVSMNADADRCVLKTESKLARWVAVRPYDDIKVGERALTIGTPQGLELTVAEGIVSSKRRHKESRLVQTSAPISQGSSGGGLFDAQGRLLGITTFYFKVGQNLNFAVAAEDYAK